MRIDFHHLSGTIAEIYAGVGHPNGFRAALDRIRKIFQASRVALVARTSDHECCYYEDRCESDKVRNNAGRLRGALSYVAPGLPIALRTEKICSSCSAGEHATRLCCCIDDYKGDSTLPSIHLSLHRQAGSLPFGESERRALESLGPHVLRAVRLSHRIDIAEADGSMGTQVMEEMRRGVVVLNARKEVVFMNRHAEALCCRARGVTATKQPSGHRTLKAISAAEDPALQRAVDAALGSDSTTRACLSSSDVVRVGGSPPSKPLLIRVAQLPPASGGERRAVLFIDDLVVKKLCDERLLTALFDLTKAELRIAIALLAGERPRDIATRFSVSEDTVRTQLRAIYAKTETGGLAPLLALLTRLADAPAAVVWETAIEPKSPVPAEVTRIQRAAVRLDSVR
jgi:DNA-binding CsgD family transcriptional regulator